MVTSLNWQPYSDAQAADQGRAINRLRTLLSKRNIQLEVEFYPWKRAQELARTDKRYVGYFPAWPVEVAEGFIPSENIYWSEIAVLTQSQSEIEFSSLAALFQQYSVGLVSTYEYPEIVTKASQQAHQVIRVADEASLARMLASGRIAVAITDPNVMNYYVDQQGLPAVKTIRALGKEKLVLSFRDDEENRARKQLLDSLLNAAR